MTDLETRQAVWTYVLGGVDVYELEQLLEDAEWSDSRDEGTIAPLVLRLIAEHQHGDFGEEALKDRLEGVTATYLLRETPNTADSTSPVTHLGGLDQRSVATGTRRVVEYA